MDSANIWQKLDKASIEPKRILAELFITSGNLAKARPLIKTLLEKEEKKKQKVFCILIKFYRK